MEDGPLVIETPPNILGIINDSWFHYGADLGNTGQTEAEFVDHGVEPCH